MKKILTVIIAAMAFTIATASTVSAQTETTSVTQTTDSGIFTALQSKLETFKAKVEKSTKADASDLFEEAKALKSEIQAATLTDEERSAISKTFNDIIDLCKKLK